MQKKRGLWRKERENGMRTGMKIFKNTEFGQMRTIEYEGRVYFVGIDIAKALGYVNPSKAVIQHCKGVTKLGIPSSGGMQSTNCIPEGDLYRLITHSELPSAEKFEVWVFDEILPSVRKYGMYAVDELLSDPDLAIKAFTALKEEREKNTRLLEHNDFLGWQIEEQQKIIENQEPKVNYVDTVLNSKSLVVTTQIAKDYGMSAVAFNRMLKDLGIQYKMNGQWVLYAKYQGHGYVHSSTLSFDRSVGGTDIIMHTEWTQKGRLFLYETLKKQGCLPTIEQGQEIA